MSPKQGVRNPPTDEQGKFALKQILETYAQDSEVDFEIEKIAVKYCLELLHKEIPGNSVELRIPPHAAVQIIAGTKHKRGTPPAVIEMKPKIWIEVAAGKKSWAQALADGMINASGLRTEISQYLPLKIDIDETKN